MRRPFWKLAALDMQLADTSDDVAHFSASRYHQSNLLRHAQPPALSVDAGYQPHSLPSQGATLLSLSYYDTSVVDYAICAHASDAHSLRLHRVFCFDAAAAQAGAAGTVPGMVRHVDTRCERPARDAACECKLAAHSAEAADAIGPQVGAVDTVIGAPSQHSQFRNMPCLFTQVPTAPSAPVHGV
jgi:hypothetical protein